MPNSTSFTCPRCQIGICHPMTGIYLRVLEGRLIRVPDMPLHHCDVCHYQEFDPQPLARLSKGLHSERPVKKPRIVSQEPLENTTRTRRVKS